MAAVKEAGFELARREPFAEHLAGWPGDWNFQSPKATEARLRGSATRTCGPGRRAWPSTSTTSPGYFGAICLGSFLERLPEALHESFVDAAVELLGAPLTIDYVRLNILARVPVS